MLDEKQKKRRQQEEHNGIARQSIRESRPARRRQILLHRHCPDVAGAALVEVARAGVVNGMLPLPVMVGREGQDAGDKAQDVVGHSGFEKGSVPAVVENDEHPHEERAGEDGQRDCEPPGDREAVVDQIPQQDIRPERVGDLPERAPAGRLLVAEQDLFPIRAAGIRGEGGGTRARDRFPPGSAAGAVDRQEWEMRSEEGRRSGRGRGTLRAAC